MAVSTTALKARQKKIAVILWIFPFIIGAAMGSFAGAQVWRLRARQLEFDNSKGNCSDKKELNKLKPLLGKNIRQDRSLCLSCKHPLAWYDMIPVVSWLSLRGKCRYCRKFIGWSEILLELGVGLLFSLSVVFWPGDLALGLEWLKLCLWLVALVALAINFMYDLRWSLLVPTLSWLVIGCGAVYAVISLFQSEDVLASGLSLLGGVAILGGLYAFLSKISQEKWVGAGDGYVGAGLALFLGDWKIAFVGLFLANLVGIIIILPQLIAGRLGRGSKVPFGPLLIIGGLLAWFLGKTIVDWYIAMVFLA